MLKKREPDLPAMLRMSDALSSNFAALESDEDVTACCMAHGRRNFVDPYDYLTELQRHSGELAADPSAWLPWTYRNSPAELAQAC